MIHIVLLGGLNLQWPTFATPGQAVKVQLMLQAPPVLAASPLPVIDPIAAQAQPGITSASQPETVTQTPPLATQAIVEQPTQAMADVEPVQNDAAPQVAEVIEDALLQDETNSSYTTGGDGYASIASAAPSQESAYIETEFDIRRSAGGSKVGVTRISYQVQPDGSYHIDSVSEADGLLSLFLSGKLVQRSEGKVADNGLQPAQFLYQYGDKASKKQHAQFDWTSGQLTLETAKGIKSEALPEGTQDLLSFMYQFMFVPPLEQMNLLVTNGKNLGTYSYSFEGEEQLATQLGEISTVHILKKGDDGEEKTELWLAVDYHYLPVKMRKTEEDGSVVEQVATRISTNTLK